MLTTDQERAIEALSNELDGVTLTIRPPVGPALLALAEWDNGKVEIGPAGFVWTLANTPQAICAWASMWNKPLTDAAFDEAGS